MTDDLTNFSEQSQEENYLHELRPKLFEDFSGQQSVVDNLKIFVEAANQRNQALDHVLLYGPPGLGKTTLASIISKALLNKEALSIVIRLPILQLGCCAA